MWLCIINNVYGIVSGKKWKRMNLTEFANHFNLSEMEKQAYIKVRNYIHTLAVTREVARSKLKSGTTANIKAYFVVLLTTSKEC